MEIINDHQQALIDAFGFSQDDLKANRAGTFSYRQLKSLETDRLINLLSIVLSISIFLASPIVSLAIGLPAFYIIAVMIAGIAGLGIYVSFTLYRRVQDDLHNPVVASVEGGIESITPLGKSSGVVYFRIRSVSFKSSYWKTDELKADEHYRVYYALHSKRVLSVEWLRYDNNLLP